jgi:predicted TIM-barrel fold metal-dependent hydrolase
MCTKDTMGIDRILLSTDYPYEDPNECLHFLESLPLSKAEREKVYYQNARRFGVIG